MPGSTLDPLLKGSWESTDGNGYRRVKAIVGSGASQSVASGSLAPEVEVTPSEGSRRGQTYAGAAKGGKPLQNEGQKVVQALTTEGQQISTTWQVVDVSRPLMSVHQICQHNNIVVFGVDGGYVLNLETGSQSHFGVEENVYVMDLFLPPSPVAPAGFRRQGAHP